MMSVVEPGFLIDIDMCFILPDYRQIENKGWFCIPKYKYKSYGIILPPQNIVTENTKTAQIRNF